LLAWQLLSLPNGEFSLVFGKKACEIDESSSFFGEALFFDRQFKKHFVPSERFVVNTAESVRGLLKEKGLLDREAVLKFSDSLRLVRDADFEQFSKDFFAIKEKILQGQATKGVALQFEQYQILTNRICSEEEQIRDIDRCLLEIYLDAYFALSPEHRQVLFLYAQSYSDHTGAEAFHIGLSPEYLFWSENGVDFKSMALAGTAPLAQSDTSFIADSKEVGEHDLVVDRLGKNLESVFGKNVKIGQKEILRLPNLKHLLTKIDFRYLQSENLKQGMIPKLLKTLHPTPALGVEPKTDENLKWYEELGASKIRGHLGSPVTLHDAELKKYFSIVAIRGVERRGTKVFIGSGCGVVKDSQLEKEWRELELKRESVKKILFQSSPMPLQSQTRACFENLNHFYHLGVRDICVSAGSRNSPLLYALSKFALSKGEHADHEKFKVWTFYDEREAGFFALGRIRSTQKPVLVITTSGTAVAELLPSMIEGHYSYLPMIVLSADRPKNFRGSGAPQAIEQRHIFSHYTDFFWEGDAQSLASMEFFVIPLKSWSGKKPIHFNLFLSEPLIDEVFELPLDLIPNFRDPHAEKFLNRNKNHDEWNNVRQRIEKFVDSASRPLIYLGSLLPEARPAVKEFCLHWGAPVLAESLSGLREDLDLKAQVLHSSERILQHFVPTHVLRIGGVPTGRFWRDLETRSVVNPFEVGTPQVNLLSVDEKEFRGLSKCEHLMGDLREIFLGNWEKPEFDKIWKGELLIQDKIWAEKIFQLLSRFPRSEVALIAQLSRRIPEHAHIFLGNSLAIREWDFVAARRQKDFEYSANRGANGIDGELSTFFGSLSLARPQVALLGDLTTLYSMSAPWILDQIDENIGFHLYVMNNGGGKIFNRLPPFKHFDEEAQKKLFQLSHHKNFRPMAEMWNLGYECWHHELAALDPGSSRSLIEIVPSNEQSEAFWTAFDLLCAKN